MARKKSMKHVKVNDSKVISNDKDGLKTEKDIIQTAIEEIINDDFTYHIQELKSLYGCVAYRQKAEESYNNHKAIHNDCKCKLVEVLKSCIKSIALAPKDSKELAEAYKCRAKMLLKINQFKSCIKDCNRGLNVSTCPDDLKADFIRVKIECFEAAKNVTFREDCEETLKLLKKLSIDDKQKEKCALALRKISKDFSTMKPKKKEHNPLTDINLPLLERMNEISFASKSIKLQYTEKSGRHFVATNNIDAGEIFAIEKCYASNIHSDLSYFICFNCNKNSFDLIPCDFCSYNVYCSEQCKSEAWSKYHEYECRLFSCSWPVHRSNDWTKYTQTESNLFSYLFDTNDLEQRVMYSLYLLSFRSMLIALKNAGSIDNLREELINNRKHEDNHKKIFGSNKIEDYFRLSHHIEKIDKDLINFMAKISSKAVCFLAMETNFFGKQHSQPSILNNKNIIFAGAVLLRTFSIMFFNFFKIDAYSKHSNVITTLGTAIYPNCAFFNHSCDPNAFCITSNQKSLIVVAKHFIPKGAQIFIAYRGWDYFHSLKSRRQEYLKRYDVNCQCIACQENWTKESVPSFWEMPGHKNIAFSDDDRNNFLDYHLKSINVMNHKLGSLKDLVRANKETLKILEKFSSHRCKEYENLFSSLVVLYTTVIGNFPYSCFDTQPEVYLY